MNLQFYYLINVIMISRLLFSFKDKPITKKRLIMMIILQFFCLLVYQLNWVFGILFLLLVLLNIFFYNLENKLKKINKLRLISLFSYIILLSIFFSPRVNLDFSSRLPELIATVEQYSQILVVVKKIDWFKLNIFLMGLLLVINEVNFLIRYQFQIFRLVPKKKDRGPKNKLIINIDEEKYNTGRIIGILERILIFFFVLKNQFAAIGFILAAKGFTRFEEMKKRESAEYILIGTLLSTLLAIIIAGITKILLP